DPDQLVSSKICRWRAPTLESIRPRYRPSTIHILLTAYGCSPRQDYNRDLGPNTPSGVPYIENEIMAKVRVGMQRGHIPDVGKVLAGRGRDVCTINEPRCTHTANDDEVKAKNKQLRKDINLLMKVVKSDDKIS
ncbi:hypothetical protein Tco_1139044, partial [Tanacetum coccineum]